MNELRLKAPWRCPLCETPIGTPCQKFDYYDYDYNFLVAKHLRERHRLTVLMWTYDTQEEFENDLINESMKNTFIR